VRVSFNVKNIGKRQGEEVPQLYVRAVAPREPRALKELRGIDRFALKPGEMRRVSFTLVPGRDFTHYDVTNKRYAVDDGSYEIQLGASSSDIRLKTTVTVNQP
jgi:beta-glucosidase